MNTDKQNDIAIIGMACVFPGAPGLTTFWQNIVDRVDCISDAPPEWQFTNDMGSQINEVYCRKGGFLKKAELHFDPMTYGIMPTGVEGAEPDQFLAIKVAYDAMADAGYLDKPGDKKNTAVILGRGSYVNVGLMNLVQHGWIVDQTLAILKGLHPEFSPAQLLALKEELVAGLPALKGETVPGFVPNIAAGRIANRLDLMGPNYLVDAACASSLIAVDNGARLLRQGECDMALVGGLQGGNTLLSYRMFCLINAMSQNAVIRPFDQAADGTILGEGVGMVVLKRRKDAERDGDRIYALIKGAGVASDGRALGLLAPRSEGAELCLRRAYETSDLAPSSVGLIEAHGTATTAGDTAEIEALHRVFGQRNGKLPHCAVGSIKSMIGHSLGAAGIAGLIKAVLALYHKVLPPTLNCSSPIPELRLEKTPFYINSETRPWIHSQKASPRRAGVSALGFGGINAHVILEEYPNAAELNFTVHQRSWPAEVFILQGESRQDLLTHARQLQAYLSQKPAGCPQDLAYTLNCPLEDTSCRLAIVAASLDLLEARVTRAIERLADPQCTRIKDRKGIYFFDAPLKPQGKLAFLFPGEGSQYRGMLAELCRHFPQARSSFDRMDRIFCDHSRGVMPGQTIFPPSLLTESDRQITKTRIWQMDGAIEAVLAANEALFKLLECINIKPDCLVGHSTGEYSALRAAAMFDLLDPSDNGRRAAELNQQYEELAAQDMIPRACLVSVGSEAAKVDSLIGHLRDRVYIGMINCIHQTVIVGDPNDIETLLKEFNRQGIVYQVLPFDRPYHTPLFEPYAEILRQYFARWPVAAPTVPVYSCTIMEPYPADAKAIRQLAVEHWIRPVEFRKTIERMYRDGTRIFVESGPRGMLTSFVDDILKGRDYVAVAADKENRSGITQFQHLVAMLAAQGVAMNLEPLYTRRAARRIQLDKRYVEHPKADTAMDLTLTLPKIDVDPQRVTQIASDGVPAGRPLTAVPDEIAAGSDQQPSWRPVLPAAAESTPDDAKTRVVQEYLRTMNTFLDVQQEVMKAFLTGRDDSPVQPTFNLHAAEAIQDTLQDVQNKPDVSILNDAATAAAPDKNTDVSPPDPDHSLPASGSSDSDTLRSVLLNIVSEKTGYPIDVLDPSVNLEADLGIDSIKRVEIISTLEDKIPSLIIENAGQIASLKTLEEIIAHLQQVYKSDEAGVPLADEIQSQSSHGNLYPERLPPLIDEIVTLNPGEKAVLRRRINLTEDLYLRHHTLGTTVSNSNGQPGPLPVVPLTMSMEMLAEAGSILMPQKVLVGMIDIRGHRWIIVENEAVDLELHAVRRPETPFEVDVKIYTRNETDASDLQPAVEGTLVFADDYGSTPAMNEFTLKNAKPSKWKPEQLYTQCMFHGPTWQAVAAMDEWAEDGCAATLKVLPFNSFFSSNPDPQFIIDPVILDAAGQVIGFWTKEGLATDVIVFPYYAKSLHIYRSASSAGHKVRCQARIRKLGEQHLSSDIRLLSDDGRLWMCLEGWEDKRFHLSPNVHAFWLNPSKAAASEPWKELIETLPNGNAYACVRDEPLVEKDEIFWNKVFARLILSPDEMTRSNKIKNSPRQFSWWLSERLVAKDAVRRLINKTDRRDISHCDIDIIESDAGHLEAGGKWAHQSDPPLHLATARVDGMIVAVCVRDVYKPYIGINIAPIELPSTDDQKVLTDREHQLLDRLDKPVQQNWLDYLCSAKSAALNAVITKYDVNFHDFLVQKIDISRNLVKLSAPQSVQEACCGGSGDLLTVKIVQKKDFIVACTVYGRY